MTDTALPCPNCSEDLFEPDARGLFQEDDEATCTTCGARCIITVDDEYAYVSWPDEQFGDIGQPTCDGSCDALAEYVGKPGDAYGCERCKLAAKEGEPG